LVRTFTETILDEYLRGIGAPVERSVEATRTELFDDRARITLKLAARAKEIFQAAWAVGCDGSRSGVRRDIGIGREGHQLKGMKMSVADTQAKWPLSQEGASEQGIHDRRTAARHDAHSCCRS